jgi:hypothetical protein
VHRRGPSRHDQWSNQTCINKSIRTATHFAAASSWQHWHLCGLYQRSLSLNIKDNPLQPSALLAPSKALACSQFASFEPYLLAHLS